MNNFIQENVSPRISPSGVSFHSLLKLRYLTGGKLIFGGILKSKTFLLNLARQQSPPNLKITNLASYIFFIDVAAGFFPVTLWRRLNTQFIVAGSIIFAYHLTPELDCAGFEPGLPASKASTC